MGEVYRARDTKLGRDVAIKVLPPHLTADPDRRARLAREARVLATLNHPHIAQVYGLEESDGVQALVMELISGETLADMIAGAGPSARGARTPSDKVSSGKGLASDSARSRPLDFRRALAIARQIADALDAAHEKGIVHRDLKPGNIKIRPDGAVKVLDFGLAKAIGRTAAPGADLSQLADRHRSGGRGRESILGTAAYMSPEQARGQAGRQAHGHLGLRLRALRDAHRPRARSHATRSRHHRRRHRTRSGLECAARGRAARRQAVVDSGACEKDPKRRLHDIADARIEIEDALERCVARAR